MKEKRYFKVLAVFSVGFGWSLVKYARIAITHVCFIALTLARSLGRCLNTRQASCSNNFLGTWQMLRHEKTCDPYILSCFFS